MGSKKNTGKKTRKKYNALKIENIILSGGTWIWVHPSFKYSATEISKILTNCEKLPPRVFRDKSLHPCAISYTGQDQTTGDHKYLRINFASEQFIKNCKNNTGFKNLYGNHFLIEYNNRFIPFKKEVVVPPEKHHEVQTALKEVKCDVLNTYDNDFLLTIDFNPKNLSCKISESMNDLRMAVDTLKIPLPDYYLKLTLAPFVKGASLEQISTSYAYLEKAVNLLEKCQNFPNKDKRELEEFKEEIRKSQKELKKVNSLTKINVEDNATKSDELQHLLDFIKLNIIENPQFQSSNPISLEDVYCVGNADPRFVQYKDLYNTHGISQSDHAIFTKNPGLYDNLEQKKMVPSHTVFSEIHKEFVNGNDLD